MNLGDYDGRTALHLAAAEGHLRCVKFLIDTCKVRHDVKDRWDQTPLSEAILFKHTKIAAILKRHDRAKALHLSKGNVMNPTGEVLCRKPGGLENLLVLLEFIFFSGVVIGQELSDVKVLCQPREDFLPVLLLHHFPHNGDLQPE